MDLNGLGVSLSEDAPMIKIDEQQVGLLSEAKASCVDARVPSSKWQVAARAPSPETRCQRRLTLSTGLRC